MISCRENSKLSTENS